MQVDGSLTLGGQAPVALSAGSRLGGDLRSSAPLSIWSAPGAASSLRVDRDAWLPADSMLDPAQLTVGRDLYLTPAAGSAADAARWGAASVSGAMQRADLPLPSPCACGPAERLDVEATVAFAATHNDNDELGFAPQELGWVDQDSSRELPCGRFHFDAIDGPAVLTLRIERPVAIFVGNLLAFIEIELGPAGSLDLFVAGWFQPRGGILGDRDRPAATRVYVHDQRAPGPVVMFGEVASNFYAPTAGVQTLGLTRHGSMFVRELLVNDTLDIRYDPAVRDPGVCGAAESEACDGCGACRDGLACVAERCAACDGDQDCCEPFECAQGRCQPRLL
jgi:hypothetical protein